MLPCLPGVPRAPPHMPPVPHVWTVSFPRVGMQIWGKEAWHRQSIDVPTFPTREPQQLPRICLLLIFCIIIAHLMNQDSRNSLQPASTRNDPGNLSYP